MSALPSTTGSYICRCGETDFGPQPVRVFFREDELWVNDPDIGCYPLETYAANLDRCTFERV